MIKPDIKKLVLLNLPYLFAFYFVDKVAAVFRMAPGTEMIDKLSGGFSNFGSAFAKQSFHAEVIACPGYISKRSETVAGTAINCQDKG